MLFVKLLTTLPILVVDTENTDDDQTSSIFVCGTRFPAAFMLTQHTTTTTMTTAALKEVFLLYGSMYLVATAVCLA